MPDDMKAAPAAADQHVNTAPPQPQGLPGVTHAEADRKAEDARAQQSFQNAPVINSQWPDQAARERDSQLGNLPVSDPMKARATPPAPPPVPQRSPAQDSMDAMRLQHAHEQLQQLTKATDQATDALYFRDDDIPRPLAIPEFSDEIAAAVHYMKYWVRREEILRHDHNMDHAECKRRNP